MKCKSYPYHSVKKIFIKILAKTKSETEKNNQTGAKQFIKLANKSRKSQNQSGKHFFERKQKITQNTKKVGLSVPKLIFADFSRFLAPFRSLRTSKIYVFLSKTTIFQKSPFSKSRRKVAPNSTLFCSKIPPKSPWRLQK